MFTLAYWSRAYFGVPYFGPLSVVGGRGAAVRLADGLAGGVRYASPAPVGALWADAG